MRIAVIGGKLQGVEAVYLAKKAGWEVMLIDKNRPVPAAGLSDSFCWLDVTREEELKLVLQDVDLVIPAMENKEALGSLVKCTVEMKVPIIFDADAYAISSSKTVSNELFTRLGIPTPSPWPLCGYPIIAKPSEASGSDGVIKIRDQQEFNLHKAMVRSQEEWVIEEYLEGPSFSIEVIGYAGQYKVLQITELQMDKFYDCKRVLSPVEMAPELRQQFEDIAMTLARSLKLQGVMDVETILHEGKLKVLEIDARLPSQTPTAVFKSTGVNMLKLLGEAAVQGRPWADFELRGDMGVVYEHIRVHPYRIEVCGEHIMAETKTMHIYRDFFGADEVITDYIPGKSQWSATLIVTGKDRGEAWEKRCEVIRRIKKELRISNYVDLFPTPMAESFYDLRSI